MPDQIPFVSYLRLGEPTLLVANECTSCGARYFDRRNACAACFATAFREVELDREGTVVSFSIVAFAAPGVEVPYVPAVVDCGGTSVRGNLRNVEPDPSSIRLGMPVRLVTYVEGVDDQGTEAVNYAFEPVEGQRP